MPAITPRLRVTVVAPYGTLGGAELWLLQLLDATDRLEVDVVVLGAGPLVSELERRALHPLVVPTGPRPIDMARSARALAGHLRRFRPEVVLGNGLKAAIVGGLAARQLGIPIVWTKHDHFHDRSIGRRVARLVDRVVATSPDLAAATGRDDAAVVLPPRPAIPRLDRSDARRYLERGHGIELGDDPTVVMLGRVVDYKGIDDAIGALRFVPSWRLVVLGDDDPSEPGTTDRLRHLAGSIGVLDRVQFAGYVPDASAYLTAFDALAMLTKLPHDVGGEGFGIAALEAGLAGIPVVATPGAPVLRHLDGAAIVVPAADPAAVARALDRLPAIAPDAVSIAAELERTHPDAASAADQLVALLAGEAARPGAGRSGGPPITIISTVFNEEATIDRLLTEIVEQLGDSDEVIVVDGGSIDATAAHLDHWAGRDDRIRWIVAPGATIAEGRNIAIGAARHGVIACTDSGCVPGPAWLQGLRAAFGEPTSPSLVTGAYEVTGDTRFQQAMAASNYPNLDEAARPGPLVRLYGRLFGSVFDPTLPTGRSMAFTSAAIEAAGGFPETLSEVVVGQRIAAGGGRCVLSTDACVSWQQRSTWRATARMYWNYGYGDGVSGSPLLLARNAARASASVLVALAASGRLGRAGGALAAVGGAAYLSLPVLRSRRRHLPLGATALIPLAMATKDVSKAAGCTAALTHRAGVALRSSATTLRGPTTEPGSA